MSIYDTIGQIVGIVAMLFNIFSYQCKKTRNLYIMQGTSGLLFAVNFYMLGMHTGAILNVINLFRGIIMSGGKKGRKWYFISILMIAYVLSVAFTYDGWLSAIALVAQIASTVAMWTDSGKIIRICQFFIVSPIWFTYDWMAKSVGGVVCEAFSIASIIVYTIRCVIEKRHQQKLLNK